MAPYTNIPLSPAELSYLHTSLSQDPPIRPDGRAPTQFRPLVAETDILPSANGSARVCFADGTEAVVAVKAEVEPSRSVAQVARGYEDKNMLAHDEDEDAAAGEITPQRGQGRGSWLEMTIEIPGLRDDDALLVFLAAMLKEALLADDHIRQRLCINARFHWRLYIDDEDPLFNDDWEAATYLYPRGVPNAAKRGPPVTLLVMCVGSSVLFDPSREELAVADAVLAISIVPARPGGERGEGCGGGTEIVTLRTIDPPSRLTAAGVLDRTNATAVVGQAPAAADTALAARERDAGRTVWRPSRGGVSRTAIARIIKAILDEGGVAQEVMEGLDSVGT